jgi:hypothetical protein
MDIFAHGVWSAIAAKKADKKLNISKFIFFGIFPDLFAFTLPFIILFYNYLTGAIPLVFPTHLTLEGFPHSLSWAFNLIKYLYPLSHSLIIFAVIFFLVRLILGRYVWEMLGWGFHIIIDIFTHSASFFPTPFLYPVSNFKFVYGVAWSAPWFMIVNYGAMLVAFYLIFLRNSKS